MDQPSPEITGFFYKIFSPSYYKCLNFTPILLGLSPKVAPDTGGTKVSIRGANLGLSEDDIIGLTLCGISHLQRHALSYIKQTFNINLKF
jgi:hypothetical protein